MRVGNQLKASGDDRPGPITVDWVVLTVAVLGLGIAVLASVSTGTHGGPGNVSDYLVNSGRTGAF